MASPLSITLKLGEGFDRPSTVLALGGELKSSICLIRNGVAELSEAIGDLEQEHVLRHFRNSVSALLSTTDISLDAIAIDMHPDYLSTQYGIQLATELGVPLFRIQHHHAHIAAAMADNSLSCDTEPLLGIALDGLGYGEDGTIWGGEFLLADYHGFERLGCFTPLPMIGGAAAIREPWRNTLAHLIPFWDEVCERFAQTELMCFLASKPVGLLRAMIENDTNAPLASSCGRLFDAVAAAVGFHRERVGFEAEAAIALEQAATSCLADAHPYPFELVRHHGMLQLQWKLMWLALLDDLMSGIDRRIIAARFHHTMIEALADAATRLCRERNISRVALSGGVFQNQLISTRLPPLLQKAGLEVVMHRNVATHDGGLSLGQAVVTSASQRN